MTVAARDGPPYSSTDFTLTCTIELNEAVDTHVMVIAEWTGPDGEILSGSDITMVSNRAYQNTLTLTSLGTSNSGVYSCSAIASPGDESTPTFITASEKGFNDIIVSVGKYHIT